MKWATLAHRHMQEIPDQVEMMERFLAFRREADSMVGSCRQEMARPPAVRTQAEMRSAIRAADDYALRLHRESILDAQIAQERHTRRFSDYISGRPHGEIRFYW